MWEASKRSANANGPTLPLSRDTYYSTCHFPPLSTDFILLLRTMAGGHQSSVAIISCRALSTQAQDTTLIRPSATDAMTGAMRKFQDLANFLQI